MPQEEVIYVGKKEKDGSWRLMIDDNGDLLIEYKVKGEWVQKLKVSKGKEKNG